MELRGGDLIDERYRLERRLGEGGMGTVWEAYDHRAGDHVALKFMRVDAARDATRVERLRREAQLIDSIRSPFVCPLLDSGVASNGQPYLTLPRLRGESLAMRIARARRVDLRDAAWLIDHVLQGLHAVHGLGVIHRDVKPANVFLCDDAQEPRAVLLDFGVAKLLGSDAPITAFGSSLGSVAYMAPEQAGRAATVDARADLYAVGATLFHALAGRLPFAAARPRELLALKLRSRPPTLEDVTAVRWPNEVESFLSTLLSHAPEDRFGSAHAAWRAWQRVCEGLATTPFPSTVSEPDDSLDTTINHDDPNTVTDIDGLELDGEADEEPTGR